MAPARPRMLKQGSTLAANPAGFFLWIARLM
jgi:hypothetical protein